MSMVEVFDAEKQDERVGTVEVRSEKESQYVACDDVEKARNLDERSVDNITTSQGEPRWEFPTVFCDPITKKIMVQPVVHPNGDSYEKPKDGEIDGIKYYPNRVLQSYIEQELDRVGASTLEQWGESLRQGLQKLAEKSNLPFGEDRPLPESFYCPITFDLIHQPVIDPDGYTYEKTAVELWIQRNGSSPVTRKELTMEQLYNNNALLSVMEHLTEEDDEVIHPSIQRWKEEHPSRLMSPVLPLTSDPAEQQQQEYPTTQAELDLRRCQHRQNNCMFYGLLAICTVSFLFVPNQLLVFTIVLVCSCGWFLYHPYLVAQQEARRQAIREAAIEQMRQEERRGQQLQRPEQQEQEQQEQQQH